MALINWADKNNFKTTDTPADQKVSADDMNEIKTAVNGLAARFGHENKTELSFSVAQIEAMGTTPLELLPAPTAGKTYAFYLVLKKAPGIAWSFPNEPLFIWRGNGHLVYVQNLILRGVEARIVHASSGVPAESFTAFGSNFPQVSSSVQDNDALVLSTWDGDNPTGGNVGLTGTIFWTEI
jgi:hypothetical protein